MQTRKQIPITVRAMRHPEDTCNAVGRTFDGGALIPQSEWMCFNPDISYYKAEQNGEIVGYCGWVCKRTSCEKCTLELAQIYMGALL